MNTTTLRSLAADLSRQHSATAAFWSRSFPLLVPVSGIDSL